MRIPRIRIRVENEVDLLRITRIERGLQRLDGTYTISELASPEDLEPAGEDSDDS